MLEHSKRVDVTTVPDSENAIVIHFSSQLYYVLCICTTQKHMSGCQLNGSLLSTCVMPSPQGSIAPERRADRKAQQGDKKIWTFS